MRANISELDAMLNDLNEGKYSKSLHTGHTLQTNDYFSDFEENTSYSALPTNYAEHDDENPPDRPPPPRSYSPVHYAQDRSHIAPSVASSNYKDYFETGSTMSTMTRRPHHPPKLQHVLKNELKHGERQHDLVKKVPRIDGIMEAPEFDQSDYGEIRREVDYSLYADYGGQSNCGTLNGKPEDPIPIDIPPEAIDEIDAGEAPRGEKSKIIKTEHGELKSKYHYLGFGLWQNTNPIERYVPKKPSPPPPPPKAEPIWYDCTVSVETHKTSKELDDLMQGLDGYDKMPNRDVEIGNAAADVPGCLGDIYEEFEKEDMSDMFKRAFLEQMEPDDNERKIHNCYVCREAIRGRVITAMAKKFHPQCFVCTYCRKEFKERSFKTDPIENRPYCYGCFEKLLGYFGNAHINDVIV
jgi:hypothetical protein